VADEQGPPAAGPAPELADDRVAEGRVGMARDLRPLPFQEAAGLTSSQL